MKVVSSPYEALYSNVFQVPGLRPLPERVKSHIFTISNHWLDPCCRTKHR